MVTIYNVKSLEKIYARCDSHLAAQLKRSCESAGLEQEGRRECVSKAFTPACYRNGDGALRRCGGPLRDAAPAVRAGTAGDGARPATWGERSNRCVRKPSGGLLCSDTKDLPIITQTARAQEGLDSDHDDSSGKPCLLGENRRK